MKKLWNRIADFYRRRRAIAITIMIAVLLFPVIGIVSLFVPTSLDDFVSGAALRDDYDYVSLGSKYGVDTYATKMKAYREAEIPNAGVTGIVSVNDITGQKVHDDDATYGEDVDEYVEFLGAPSDAVLIDSDTPATFTHPYHQSGLYYLAIDYKELTNAVSNTQLRLTVNGISPFYESQTLILPSSWAFVNRDFTLDRYDNEIQPRSEKIQTWRTWGIEDGHSMNDGLLAFEFAFGDVISIETVDGECLIGAIRYVQTEQIPSYDEYLTAQGDAPVVEANLRYSARGLLTRSDPSIRLRTEQDPSSLSYATDSLKLNTLFGDSWRTGGQSVSYDIEVPTTGYYHLSFKYRQYNLRDMPTFRDILIDGEIPFKNLSTYAFPYTTNFLNRTLVDEEGNPLKIHLAAGTHVLTFKAVAYPYRQAVETIQYLMNRIQSLALNVKRYTSGGTDQYRDWDIATYFPEAEGDIRAWAQIIDDLHAKLVTLASKPNPSEISNLNVAAARLRNIADNINKLPSLMVQFSDGDSSVAQLLGAMMQNFLRPGLEFERFIVHGDVKLDSPRANIFLSSYENVARLVLSFFDKDYATRARGENELAVWVNHPRQYIEIMQQLIDREYDGEKTITLSQMPDQNKLILANASGQSPDVAVGVDHWIPFDFASREASLDLRQFDGYEDLVSHFAKGAMIPYVFEEGVYGFPETQNFWVTYYRKDILSSIGVTDIPQTWSDIIGLLPLLQSYGMNYFVPLSQYSGLKPFVATLPFIYQFGGDLYTANGMQTAIYSEETLSGIKLMSDLFTLYNIPKYVASFYNNFRYGTLPIGISDLSTYLLLESAAPELDGMWGMDLHPGTPDADTGDIVRYAASGAQSSMILSNTDYPEESWDFLEWWMSADVQAEFAFLLQSTYGKAYFWNSANLDAFAQMSMPTEYKNVILSQWDYALEAARIPGAYMVEREISNAWTNIVFNGVNPRQAIDEAVRIANREILYKMEEFGYVVDGQIVKPYPVPSIYNIDQWLTEH